MTATGSTRAAGVKPRLLTEPTTSPRLTPWAHRSLPRAPPRQPVEGTPRRARGPPVDYGDKPAAAKRSLLTPPRWSLFAPPLTAAVLRRSPASVSSPRRRWSRRSAMAHSSARADSFRPGSVWCPGSTRVAARIDWDGYRSAGMAISGACSCMVREPCCAGAAPSRARGLAGPTGSWRGGRQTWCWSPWPIRQPVSPGHCSGTSVSTDRRRHSQLANRDQIARVTTI